MAYGRDTLISIREGSAGYELSAADHETFTTHSIFRPASRTKRHRGWYDHPVETAGIPLHNPLLADVWLQESGIDEIGHRQSNRAQDYTRTRGGGHYVFILDVWCSNVVKVDGQCFPDVEFLSLKCRPYYLTREFTVLFIHCLHSF